MRNRAEIRPNTHRRSVSLAQPTFLDAAAPEPPEGRTPWDRDRIFATLASARQSDLINVWWFHNLGLAAAQLQEQDPSVSAIAHDPILHLWRGRVEEVRTASLGVRWPAGMPDGPTPGVYEFPGPAILNGDCSVVAIKFQRRPVPTQLRFTPFTPEARPAADGDRETRNGTRQETARTVEESDRRRTRAPEPRARRQREDEVQVSSEDDSERRPARRIENQENAGRRGGTFSRFLVPLIASATNYEPMSSARSQEWSSIRTLIGRELFDDTSLLLARNIDDEEMFHWRDDYISSAEQDAATELIIMTNLYQQFAERAAQIMREETDAREIPPRPGNSGFWDQVRAQPERGLQRHERPPSDFASALERFTEAVESRKLATTTVQLAKGLKIPSVIAYPYTALYFTAWGPGDENAWVAAHSALLALFPGFRTESLRSKYSLAKSTIMQLWLNSVRPRFELRVTPKEELWPLWQHTAELVGCLMTSSLGEAAARTCLTKLETQYNDGYIDLRQLLRATSDDIEKREQQSTADKAAAATAAAAKEKAQIHVDRLEAQLTRLTELQAQSQAQAQANAFSAGRGSFGPRTVVVRNSIPANRGRSFRGSRGRYRSGRRS